jgi:hypothetical protein
MYGPEGGLTRTPANRFDPWAVTKIFFVQHYRWSYAAILDKSPSIKKFIQSEVKKPKPSRPKESRNAPSAIGFSSGVCHIRG